MGTNAAGRTLWMGRQQVEWHRTWFCADPNPRPTADAHFYTEQWLRRFKANAASMAAIRKLLSLYATTGHLSRMDDENAIEQFAVLLNRGLVHLHLLPLKLGRVTTRGDDPVGAVSASTPAAARSASTPSRKETTEKAPEPVLVPKTTPAPKKPKKPAWTVDDLKKEMDKCDGGLNAKAKKANGDKDPIVVQGKSAIGTGGSTDTETGTITLDTNQSKCDALDTLAFELQNLSSKADFDKVANDAAEGKLSRDEYIRGYEKIEYETGKNTLAAFDGCKAKWGCKASTEEWLRKYKSFDQYFKNGLSPKHKEHYGKFWDENHKKKYQETHPPKPAKK